MSLPFILFFVFAFIAVAGAILLILAREPIHSALALILVMVAWLKDRRRGHLRIERLIQEQAQGLADARKESVEKSRSSLKGQIAEQMAPLLPGFRYLPADARFLGDPIDYIVFHGYTGVRDARALDESLEVVLLEVKQGGSALSGFQKAIAAAVQAGRVRFEVCRVLPDGTIGTETWRPRKAGGLSLE
jgi:predicted Holliday junction resolvase-like endonuclease